MAAQGQYKIVDDQDPSIQYAGGWEHAQVPAVFQATNDTISFATANGATATYSFTTASVVAFEAVCLTLFESASDTIRVNFTLDGSTTIQYSPGVGVNATDDECYSSPTLSGGIQHELVVTVAGGNAKFGLDGFAIVGNVTAPGGDSGSSPDHKSSTPVGAIVGGVLGGVALIMAAFLAVYLIWWRRRNSRPYFFGSVPPGDMFSEEKVTPFSPPPSTTGAVSLFSASHGGSSSAPSTVYAGAVGMSFANAAAGTTIYAPSSVSYGSPADAPESTYGGSQASASYRIANTSGPSSRLIPGQPLTTAQRKATEAGVRTTPLPGEVQQHADSGVRFGQSSSSADAPVTPAGDVPPVYSES